MEYSYKRIWQISYPIILGGLAQAIINITDSAFMGRVSEVALGAAAIGGLFYVTIFMLGFGFGVGAQIIIARLDGEKKPKEIGEVFHHTLYFLLLLGLVSYLFLYFIAPYTLRSFVNSNAIYDSSVAFIQMRSWGIFFTFIIVALRAFFVGIADTKIVSYSTILSAVLNIILNYVFVFGKFGYAPMGIAGSALASNLSEAIACIYAIIYTFKTVDRNHYSLFKFDSLKIKLERVKSIFVVAAPVMFQLFLAVFSWFVFFMIVEKIGERELAISNLVRNAYIILMIPLIGFSSATNTIISNLIGQKKQNEVFSTMYRICIMSIVATAILMLVNLVLATQVLSIFTNDLSLIKDTLPCIYIISGSLILFSFTTIILGSVSGTGNTMASLIIEFITIVFYLWASYIMAVSLKSSIEMVWAVEYVYFIFMGGLAYLYLRKGNWRELV